MTCSYIFKKGKNKGQLCNELCEKDSKYCIKHGSVDIINPSSTKIDFNKTKEKKTKSADDSIDQLIFKKITREDNLKQKIIELNTSIENKTVIIRHYNNMRQLDVNSSEYYKNKIFVDLSISYPWNKFFDINDVIQNDIHKNSIRAFILYLKSAFDKYIYGMDNVKNEIINIVCKFITNPQSNRNNIALCGPAGVGKNRFIKILSDVLGLPMKVISLGGVKDTSFFLGHGYVYVESGPGKIIQNIIDSKISNPIIYFDELDKVSKGDGGKDIYSFLTYLTDPTQNVEYSDHYFYGMKFDLSKVFYIFTFNDIELIDRVLLDRLNIIHVDSPSTDDIINILGNYSLQEIKKNIGIQNEIIIERDCFKIIINHFKQFIDPNISSGIREYYRALEKILLEINKDILLENINCQIIKNNTTSDSNKTIFLNTHNFEIYFNKIKSQIITTNSKNNDTYHLTMYN